ncbi:MAG: DEAD/DEAH box helicase [Calditrichaeota bacterium]|nr:DEAD/DEAH box helicase [Calditrichota bacterium]
MSEKTYQPKHFNELNLSEPVMQALNDVGYETPTPIQAETIPYMLEGSDVVGQAQTGTGKTAAFAMPLLSQMDLTNLGIQVLVLTPTRELAIQVAEAFQRYAAHLNGFHVLPIYGGQEYGGQLRRLKRGVHVVVGTPGRVMDHMRRGTLKLGSLRCLVLDEADEMLRMGFIDDVEWILEQTPSERQIALFSATMPRAIRQIARKYLNNPREITIKSKTATLKTTRQRYLIVNNAHKLDALTRILEAENFEGIIVFVRTKTLTLELSQKLEARGYDSAPLNGDLSQNQRERTIDQFRSSKINILVATDVAARGLDFDHISHIINYDIPSDTGSYVHRIGRTGRAGRSGEAILFVTPREKSMLHAIERTTNQKIEMMDPPSPEVINNQRIAKFKQRITDTLNSNDLDFFRELIYQYQQETDVPVMDIAAALARLFQGDEPMLLSKMRRIETFDNRPPHKDRKSRRRNGNSSNEVGMERYRIEVGDIHGVKPGNILGAIANETGIDGKYIGQIRIFDDFSTVDLPEGIPQELLRELKRIWVANQQLNISRYDESANKDKPARLKPKKAKRFGKSSPKSKRMKRVR